jgi:hypothetical protein
MYRPILNAREIDGRSPSDPSVPRRPWDHGICATLGFRIGRFAHRLTWCGRRCRVEALRHRAWIVTACAAGASDPRPIPTTLGWTRAYRRGAIFTHRNHQAIMTR